VPIEKPVNRPSPFVAKTLVTAEEYADALGRLRLAGDILAAAGLHVFVEDAPRRCTAEITPGKPEAMIAATVVLVWRPPAGDDYDTPAPGAKGRGGRGKS
jgi:hypothetical protein